MSDDAQAARDGFNAIAAHGGWVAAAIASFIAWAGKLGIGRTIRQLDRIDETLGHMDARLSRIEGRFEEMDNDR